MDFKNSIFHDLLQAELPLVQTGAEDVQAHFSSMSEFIAGIPSGILSLAYAPGKWTVAQVLGHIIDSQVVFLYRILNISRGEKVSLPGFDEQLWVANGRYQALDIEEIRSLYEKASSLTGAFLVRLQASDLELIGEANGITISVEEIIRYMLAHEMHHRNVLRQRYFSHDNGRLRA